MSATLQVMVGVMALGMVVVVFALGVVLFLRGTMGSGKVDHVVGGVLLMLVGAIGAIVFAVAA